MKAAVKYVLQKVMGFKTYLYVFARYKINNLHKDANEKDFFVFMDQLEDGGVLLDIGANIGIMTSHLSKRFPNASIHAFEPIPANVATLEKVIGKYKLKNVKVHPVALGNENGMAEMVLPVEKNVREQGLSHVVHDSITEFNDGVRFEVPLHTLDTFEPLQQEQKRVAGIKMDVENFEFFVLDGARKLLKSDHPVIYTELWDNDNRKQCFDLAEEMQYAIHVVENGELLLYDPKVHTKQNFIFIPIP